MLLFEEGGKPENPEKNPRSKGENQQQTQPTYDAECGNRTRATLVVGERSHHCAIPAPLCHSVLSHFIVEFHQRQAISPVASRENQTFSVITGVMGYGPL